MPWPWRAAQLTPLRNALSEGGASRCHADSRRPPQPTFARGGVWRVLGCSCAPACHLERLDELLDLPDLNVGIVLHVLCALLLRHAHLPEVQTAERLTGAALSPVRCSNAGAARIALLRWFEAARGAQRDVRVLSPLSSSSCWRQSSQSVAAKDASEGLGGGQ